MLLATRRQLVGEIPPDSRWYRLSHLSREHLPELLVIARDGWDDAWGNAQNGNEVLNVAPRRPQPLRTDPSAWSAIVLWGHTRQGPFTILEGNNRMLAYASSDSVSVIPRVYVGLSPSYCWWHLPDAAVVVAVDMWQQ